MAGILNRITPRGKSLTSVADPVQAGKDGIHPSGFHSQGIEIIQTGLMKGKTMVSSYLRWICLLLGWTLMITLGMMAPSIARGALEDKEDEGLPVLESGWAPYIQGGALHQFDVDIDDGSRFSVNRYFIQGGLAYTVDAQRSVSLALGYGLDSYDFSGNAGFGLLDPWKDIHNLRFSAPVRWGIDRDWSVYFVPTVRVAAESGASWGGALMGGGFAGFSYRVSDRLTIGPGIGFLRQIEDNSVFPVLLIDWKITDDLSLQTGRGVGATLGPGIMLNWNPLPKWQFGVGGRYEKLRFRMDKGGPVPKGIGDDRALPLVGTITYRFTKDAQVSLMGGVDLAGKLRLEDENGNLVTEEDHDPAPILGISFRFRL
jgi:hypothetical protein